MLYEFEKYLETYYDDNYYLIKNKSIGDLENLILSQIDNPHKTRENFAIFMYLLSNINANHNKYKTDKRYKLLYRLWIGYSKDWGQNENCWERIKRSY